MINDLAAHVAAGLSETPKKLSSMYFYDAAGSRLFQQIMDLPEYYPTRTEYSIFAQHAVPIVAELCPPQAQGPFSLVELGAGDGLKTKLLLRALLHSNQEFTYVPVDISPSAIDGLVSSLRQEFPDLQVAPIVADYATALAQLPARPGRKSLLFLGSNIGNFDAESRATFLSQLAAPLGPDDRLLVGFDLQKNPRRIQAAYDDTQGVTAAFNLNLLTRLNQELGANFDLNSWQHYASYDPIGGVVRSFLASIRPQTVHFSVLGQSFQFAAWEVIHTENSYKFTAPIIEELAATVGLQVTATFTDSAVDFADVVMAPR